VGKQTIIKALKEFGLTEKESEIYIFLAKHGSSTGGEISKQTKTHRALIYRILKNLQKKGVVESTLESPVRFFSVPFEKVLDENIKMKHKEASSLEKSKNNLLNDWEKIGSSILEPDVGKFFVIKGNRKIYSKISQMIKQTQNDFSAILTVP
jgi:sugar-specific transcriptional regulator TrmB